MQMLLVNTTSLMCFQRLPNFLKLSKKNISNSRSDMRMVSHTLKSLEIIGLATTHLVPPSRSRLEISRLWWTPSKGLCPCRFWKATLQTQLRWIKFLWKHYQQCFIMMQSQAPLLNMLSLTTSGWCLRLSIALGVLTKICYSKNLAKSLIKSTFARLWAVTRRMSKVTFTWSPIIQHQWWISKWWGSSLVPKTTSHTLSMMEASSKFRVMS